MNKKMCIWFLGILLLTGIELAAEEIIDMDDIVVVGERFENSVKNVPKGITIITAEEIEKSGAKNIFEAILLAPGAAKIDVTLSGKAGCIDIRGQGEFAPKNVLILIDGISLVQIEGLGPDFSPVSLEQVTRIEILSGGGVLYGDRAVGGVINIITKGNKHEGLNFGGKYELGSYYMKDEGFNLGFVYGSTGADISYQKGKSDGYRNNSGYSDDKIIFNLKTGTKNRLKLSIKKYNEEYQMPGYLLEEELKKDKEITSFSYNNISSKGTNYSLALINNLKLLTLETVFGYNENTRKTEWIWKEIGEVEKKSVTDTKTTIKNIETKLKIKRGSITNILGIDYSLAKSESSGRDTNKDLLGLFSYNKWNLTENISLVGGYRKESVKWKDNFNEKEWLQDLYELGANLSYSLTGSLYSTYLQTYRTPSTYELYYIDTSNREYKYNEALEPQKSNNIEIGIKELLFESIKVGLSGFMSKTTKEIIYNPSTQKNENAKYDVDRIGAEVKLVEYFFENISLSQYGSYIEAKLNTNDNDKKYLPGVPLYSAGGDIGIEITDELQWNIDYRYRADNYVISDWENTKKKQSGYSNVNTTVTYSLGEWKIYGGVKNILDTKYSECEIYYPYKNIIGYYPSSERNFYAGVKLDI